MKKNVWMKNVWIIVLIAYILMMIVGAMIPSPDSVPVFGGRTKYFHFLGFAVLALLVLKTSDIFKFKKLFILAAIFGLLFAFITECLQLLVSTRHFLYSDIGIDMIGYIIGMLAYRWIFYKK